MDNGTSLAEIQAWWQIPAIAHFFKIFQKFLSSPQFDIDELEESLISGDEENTLILDLVYNILTSYFGRTIDDSNWRKWLKKALDYWSEDNDFENPIHEDSELKNLPTFTKVQILYFLCHLRMDCNDVLYLGYKVDFKIMNAQELGCDKNKAVYWYFHDSRIYREIPEQAQSKPILKKTVEKKQTKRQKKMAVKKDKNSDDSDQSNEPTWKIVCQSEEQWLQFIEKISKSCSKNERDLGSTVKEVYETCAKSMFEIKAKEMKRKLLELAVKRESRRIAVKRKIKEDEEKLIALEREKKRKIEENLKEKHRKIKEEEETRTKAEEREKRLLLRNRTTEDRKLRAEIRGNKSPTWLVDDFSNEKSDFELSSTYCKMEKLMADLFTHPDSWLFIEAVDEEYAPDYYSIIEKPMYLNMMKTKLKERKYKSFNDMAQDFELLISNCHTYNGFDSDCSSLANNLQRTFKRSCRKLGLKFISEVGEIVFVKSSSRQPAQQFKPDTLTSQQKDGIDILSDEAGDVDLPADRASVDTDLSSSNHLDEYASSSSSDFDDFKSVIEKKQIQVKDMIMQSPATHSLPLVPTVPASIDIIETNAQNSDLFTSSEILQNQSTIPIIPDIEASKNSKIQSELLNNVNTPKSNFPRADLTTTETQKTNTTPTWSYRSMSACNNNASTIKLQNISNLNCPSSNEKLKAVSKQNATQQTKDINLKNGNNLMTLTKMATNNEDNLLVKSGSPLSFQNYGVHSITKDENGRTMVKLVKKNETMTPSSTS